MPAETMTRRQEVNVYVKKVAGVLTSRAVLEDTEPKEVERKCKAFQEKKKKSAQHRQETNLACSGISEQ